MQSVSMIPGRLVALFGLLALLLALPSPGFGQTPETVMPSAPASSWRILRFPEGSTSFAQGINQQIALGYFPVGIETTESGGLEVLVVKDTSRSGGLWIIRQHSDWNALEAEITASMQEGLVPADISRHGGGLAILWVAWEGPGASSWIISTSANNDESISGTLEDAQARGFSLQGLSVHQDLVWYLFLKNTDLTTARVVTYSSDANQIIPGVNEATADGWRPAAFASTGSTVLFAYLR